MEESATPVADILELLSDPERGIPELLSRSARARERGEALAVHIIGDALVPLLIHAQLHLEEAEDLARELTKFDPDRIHLGMLANIYALQGRETEAAQAKRAAQAAPDHHSDPEILKVIDEVAAEHDRARKAPHQ